MMVICLKQDPSNIWSLIHENVKQHWGSVEKSVTYKKSMYFGRAKQLVVSLRATSQGLKNWKLACAFFRVRKSMVECMLCTVLLHAC